jgi:DNA invertase Pin-like site-specific DNA recombinase
MLIGYARVSSNQQNLDSQLDALNQTGCEKIFQEKKSGKQHDNREQLQLALDFVRHKDTLVITRLDRLARSVGDLHNILDKLNSKNVSLKVIEQDIDTSTSTGKLMFGLLGLISEFETDLRAERQADGIKAAQKRGTKFGAKRKMTDEQVFEAIELQKTELTNQG